MDMMLDKNVCI